MKRQKVGPNERCPCGSGHKYKVCCSKKGFTWVRGPDGTLGREVPLNDDLQAAITEAKELFEKKHGRAPGPNDHILDFDEKPEELTRRLAADMRKMGLHPAYVYAFEKTGMLVGPDNEQMFSTADLQEFRKYQEEYIDQHGGSLLENPNNPPVNPAKQQLERAMAMANLLDKEAGISDREPYLLAADLLDAMAKLGLYLAPMKDENLASLAYLELQKTPEMREFNRIVAEHLATERPRYN